MEVAVKLYLAKKGCLNNKKKRAKSNWVIDREAQYRNNFLTKKIHFLGGFLASGAMANWVSFSY